MQYQTRIEYVDAIQLKSPMIIKRAAHLNDDYGEVGDWLVIEKGESKFMTDSDFVNKYTPTSSINISPYIQSTGIWPTIVGGSLTGNSTSLQTGYIPLASGI